MLEEFKEPSAAGSQMEGTRRRYDASISPFQLSCQAQLASTRSLCRCDQANRVSLAPAYRAAGRRTPPTCTTEAVAFTRLVSRAMA